MRRIFFLALLACASAVMATKARAHAHLERAVPPVGGMVTTSPGEIRLTFSEAVEPALTGIVIADPVGKKVTTGRPVGDPDKAEVVVPVTQPLAPGLYTVKWHTVSTDSHKTQGTFTFTVGP
jgi:copper resistance protein C